MPEAGQSEKMHFFTHTIKIVNNERAYTIESTWKSFVQFDDVSPCKPVIILFTTHTQSSFLRFFCLHYMSVLRDFFFSSHNFFLLRPLEKKPYADTLFCLTVCIYVYVRPFYVMRILRIFLWHILFPYFPFIVIFFFSSFDLFSIFRLFCIIFVYVCAFHNSSCIRAFIRSNTIVFIWTGAIHMNVRTLHKWKSHFIATLSFRQSTRIYYNHIFFINGTSTFRVN